MTIEEKLTHFYDTSVEEARRQAEKDVQAHKDSLDTALEEHKKMSLENAAESTPTIIIRNTLLTLPNNKGFSIPNVTPSKHSSRSL